MSHLVEVYAKDLGVKIGKAQLINHYFPIGTDNYIVMSSQSPIQSNQYDYWDVVFHILNPILNRNKINVIDLTSLEATPNQKNYIIKNSKGFLGHLDHYSLIADIYNIPNVSIIGNTYPETNKPENAKVLAPDFSEIKPSFSAVVAFMLIFSKFADRSIARHSRMERICGAKIGLSAMTVTSILPNA